MLYLMRLISLLKILFKMWSSQRKIHLLFLSLLQLFPSYISLYQLHPYLFLQILLLNHSPLHPYLLLIHRHPSLLYLLFLLNQLLFPPSLLFTIAAINSQSPPSCLSPLLPLSPLLILLSFLFLRPHNPTFVLLLCHRLLKLPLIYKLLNLLNGVKQ